MSKKRPNWSNAGDIALITLGVLIALFLALLPVWLYLGDMRGANVLVPGAFFDFLILIAFGIWIGSKITAKIKNNKKEKRIQWQNKK